MRAPERLQLVDRLAFWTEEVFCDLFAVRLIGFCFSLAFVELFDVSTVLDENSAYSPYSALPANGIPSIPAGSISAPSTSWCSQTGQVGADLQRIDSHYVRTLEAAAALDESDFGFAELKNYSAIDPAIVLAAFFAVAPRIFDELDVITAGLTLGTTPWQTTDRDIALYLQNGIVPSTIRSEVPGNSPRTPEPVSLLISLYKFYLEGLNLLIGKIENANAGSNEDRTKWARKVETWTSKAVEDVLLMTRRLS